MLTAILSLAFFLSGAAALVFEIVWFHRAGLAFGNSVVAVTVVLSSFMAGIAVGNACARRIASSARGLLIAYAVLELAIGIAGLALTWTLPRLSRLDLPLPFAFVLLLVPTAAMGATLPVLVAALTGLTRGQTAFGRALGILYGWNTLGAMSGALGAEFVLIRAVGVAGAAWIAAGLNVAAACSAMAIASRTPQFLPAGADVTKGSDCHVTVRPLRYICAAALAGFALLALEVIWFRFLSLFMLTTTQTMSMMLAVVLFGIAIGSLTIGKRSPRRTPTDGVANIVALGAAAALVSSYALFRFTSGNQIGAWTTVATLTAVLALPTAMLSGMLFTLLGVALRERAPDAAHAASMLTLANTVGAATGAPAAGFLLLPALGTERSLFALALVYIVIAVLLSARIGLRRVATTVSVAGIVVFVFPFGAMSTELARMASPYAADGSQIVATRDGPSESIVLMQQRWMGKPVYSRLVTNGFSMSGTAIPGQRYMRYFVYWPMLLHARPLQRLLVICYGAGVTASAATDVTSAATIDVVEISRDIAAMSDIIYAGDRHPLRDRRVTLHVDDGRHFLQTTGERYDLITGEPPPPRSPGAVNIYTREYFQLIRDRLADGGIATYWVPVARPHPGADVDTIIRAFCDVFDDCSLWNATPFDFMLAGSRGGIGSFDASRFDAIRIPLSEIGFETPEQIGATFLGDASFLRELTASVPPLTDDFPQRLRPSVRPSLSDPRYPNDSAAVAEYARVSDPVRARLAFERSEAIARWWPAALRQATRPWFDTQGVINRVLWEGGQPLRLFDDLDATLTHTQLRTLPLWILGTDAVKQRIAASGNDGTGAVEYARGAQLLADRDYEDAASYFGLAERKGLQAPALRPLIAYALCKAGRIEIAKQVAANIQPREEDERHFMRWMNEGCRAAQAGGAGQAGQTFRPTGPALPASPALPAR